MNTLLPSRLSPRLRLAAATLAFALISLGLLLVADAHAAPGYELSASTAASIPVSQDAALALVHAAQRDAADASAAVARAVRLTRRPPLSVEQVEWLRDRAVAAQRRLVTARQALAGRPAR